MDIRTVFMRTRFRILQSTLIICIEARFTCKCLIIFRMEKILHKITAQLGAIEVLDIGLTINDLRLIIGERDSATIIFRMIVRTIQKRWG